MAHIAVIMTGLTGNLNSSLEVASRLESEGHRVTCLSVKDIKEQVERYGKTYVQLPEINFSFSHDNLSRLQNASWLQKFQFHLKFRKKIYSEGEKILGLDVYEEIISELQIEKAVIDQELHDLIFVCHKLKIPVTLLNSWFSNHMGNGTKLPPLRTDIIPKHGMRGSNIGILYNWVFIRLKVQARILVDKLFFKGYRRTTLKKYAVKNKFPFNKVISTNLPQLFSYTSLPVLSLTMSEMDFPHKKAKNFEYVGPMVYDKRDTNKISSYDEVVNDILSLKQQNGKKLIYCSASSLMQSKDSFIMNVIKAVEGNEDWIMIMSLGGKSQLDRFQTEENNIHIFPWVPQLKILEHTDCCITPAGINSINECIHFAVPMLVYSLKVADQNGCAARIDYHGLGITGDRDNESHLQIRQKVKTIIEEPSFTEKATFFNKVYQQYQKRELTPLLN